MSEFACGCGMRTTAPFYVNGMMLCTVCTERFYPHLVNNRARTEWGKLNVFERRNQVRAEHQRRRRLVHDQI